MALDEEGYYVFDNTEFYDLYETYLEKFNVDLKEHNEDTNTTEGISRLFKYKIDDLIEGKNEPILLHEYYPLTEFFGTFHNE